MTQWIGVEYGEFTVHTFGRALDPQDSESNLAVEPGQEFYLVEKLESRASGTQRTLIARRTAMHDSEVGHPYTVEEAGGERATILFHSLGHWRVDRVLRRHDLFYHDLEATEILPPWRTPASDATE